MAKNSPSTLAINISLSLMIKDFIPPIEISSTVVIFSKQITSSKKNKQRLKSI